MLKLINIVDNYYGMWLLGPSFILKGVDSGYERAYLIYFILYFNSTSWEVYISGNITMHSQIYALLRPAVIGL